MLLRGDDSHFGPAQGIARHRLPQFGRISQKIGVMLHSKPAIVKGTLLASENARSGRLPRGAETGSDTFLRSMLGSH